MYPARFRYHRATSVDEAVDALAQLGDGARVLAGGASLIPRMKYREVRPAAVIDIGRLADLSGIHHDDDTLTIRAMTRHVDVEDAASRLPAELGVLAEIAAGIGDPQVRNMGTIGGSIAAMELTGDWGPALLATNGHVTAVSASGERTINADELFIGPRTCALRPDELLREVVIPRPAPGTGIAHHKIEIRAGTSIALCSALVTVFDGQARDARIALGGIEEYPLRVTAAEQELIGHAPTADRTSAASHAVREAVTGFSDVRGTDRYRRHLAGALTDHALTRAIQRANGSAQ